MAAIAAGHHQCAGTCTFGRRPRDRLPFSKGRLPKVHVAQSSRRVWALQTQRYRGPPALPVHPLQAAVILVASEAKREARKSIKHVRKGDRSRYVLDCGQLFKFHTPYFAKQSTHQRTINATGTYHQGAINGTPAVNKRPPPIPVTPGASHFHCRVYVEATALA